MLLSLDVFTQFLVFMAANSQFLAFWPKQAAGTNVLYFVVIIVTLLTLGGLLEFRRELWCSNRYSWWSLA